MTGKSPVLPARFRRFVANNSITAIDPLGLSHRNDPPFIIIGKPNGTPTPIYRFPDFEPNNIGGWLRWTGHGRFSEWFDGPNVYSSDVRFLIGLFETMELHFTTLTHPCRVV